MKKLYGISKVIFPLLIIGLIIYLFYAQPFGHRPIKFGSTYMTMNNDFYQTLNEPIANEIDDHNDILYSRNPELSVNNQVNEINNFIKNEVKVIFINPVDGTSTKLIRALKLLLLIVSLKIQVIMWTVLFAQTTIKPASFVLKN